MEPALGVDYLPSRLRLVEIALHHVVASAKDLAVLSEADFDPVDRYADGPEADRLRGVEGDDRRSLGQPIPFQDRQTQAGKGLRRLSHQRRATGDTVAPAAAGPLADPGDAP